MQDKPLEPEDFDFSEIIQHVDEEKQIKASLSKEEKKRQGHGS
jgi:hypothetical protein